MNEIYCVIATSPITHGRAENPQIWLAGVPADEGAGAQAYPVGRTVELNLAPLSEELATRLNFKPDDVQHFSIASAES